MKERIDQIKKLLDQHWQNNGLIIEHLADRFARIRRSPSGSNDLRPGGTVSGPFMMSMVDTALYVAILSETGLQEMAVTTNINVNFLAKPKANTDVIAECRLIKVGRKLVVGEVNLYSDDESQVIAHATGTYSLPSQSHK